MLAHRSPEAAFLIRFADDFVLVFQRESDAWRVLEVLPKRFGKYGLSLHHVSGSGTTPGQSTPCGGALTRPSPNLQTDERRLYESTESNDTRHPRGDRPRPVPRSGQPQRCGPPRRRSAVPVACEWISFRTWNVSTAFAEPDP